MAQTVAEKILSRKSGSRKSAGEIAVCEVDGVLGTDGSAPMALDYYRQIGVAKVHNPDKVVFALDHYAPAPSVKTAELHKELRAFALEHGIRLYDVGDGIGHQLMVERGHVLPGALVLGADSHAVTYGALNAFGSGIGSSDLAVILACGKAWLKVPSTIRVNLTGELRYPAAAKDVALELLRQLGGDGASYAAMEFCGDGIASLEIEDRFVISNMVVEMGAKAGIFPFDQRTRDYLSERVSSTPFEPVAADPGAAYSREISVDMSALTSLVARPHRPDLIANLEEETGRAVQMVYLGTCTGGRTKDFREALEVLRAGGGIAPHVQLVVTPASRAVMQELASGGELAEYLAMGATVVTPGCGSCCGTCGAIPGDSVNVISTANRNFKGRMGNPNANIYLASPVACAAAAVSGVIQVPGALRND